MSSQTPSKLTIDRYETLFLGGLKPNLTKQDLFTHFSYYGELIDISIKIDPRTGCNKGFAFILYKDPSVANQVISTPQILDGRSVECKISFGGRHNQRDRFEASRCKIFVSNLHMSITNQDLSEHFKRYGDLRHAYVIYHPKTGVSRGFGYIHYQEKESVDKALDAENMSPYRNFKCERYSMHVKRDQEKKRNRTNSDEDDLTSIQGNKFENRAGCNFSPTKISNSPEKNGSPLLQNNQEAMDYNNQDGRPLNLDHTGQFALTNQNQNQNQNLNQARHPQNPMPHQNNYRANCAKPNINQSHYQSHPQHQPHPHSHPHPNAQPFYPTYSPCYDQTPQYQNFQPQYQNFHPTPQYQHPQDQTPHYVVISETEHQTMQFLYYDSGNCQFTGGSPPNYPRFYGENAGGWYYDPSLPVENLNAGYWGQEWGGREGYENLLESEKNYHKEFCGQGGNAFNLNSFDPRLAGDYQKQAECLNQAVNGESSSRDAEGKIWVAKSLDSLKLFATNQELV
jgi:RNA recognition motif-containing protein